MIHTISSFLDFPPLPNLPTVTTVAVHQKSNEFSLTCNCNEDDCIESKIHNCTSKIGCYASFIDSPVLRVAHYGCLEKYRRHKLIRHVPCNQLSKDNNGGTGVQVIKCCYNDKCNVEELLIPYFPTQRKYLHSIMPQLSIKLWVVYHK